MKTRYKIFVGLVIVLVICAAFAEKAGSSGWW